MPEQWDAVYDVVVVGSGAAGLSAAVTAAAEGSSVLVLERADRLGGTTAYSGGVAWIPNNDHMRELEIPDSREDVLRYLERLAQGRVDSSVLEAFVDAAPEAARFLEAETPLRFHAAGRGNPFTGRVEPFPDYQSALPGAAANGRSLDPLPFDPVELGAFAELVREPMPYSTHWSGPGLVVDGKWVGGLALVGALLRGCLDRGVEFERGARARRLVRGADGVEGLTVNEQDGAPRRIGARKGVVLASGGFEWNEALRQQYLRGPADVLLSPAGQNEGDGLLMAMDAGAAAGNLSEAWWTTVLQIPDEPSDGQSEYRFCTTQRSYPGAIMVNRAGRRFVNESVNYNDIVKAFHAFDPGQYLHPNRPAWVVFGRGYRERYGLLTVAPDAPDPEWLQPAASLDELAARHGIDPAGLVETVQRFDRYAEEGRDPDFGRGEAPWDLATGDLNREGVARTLAPVGEPPYYAAQVHIALLGTNGGVRTSPRAEVLDVWGEPIAGLYAAGNAMAAPTGGGYGGGGGTIGPALTFGYLAGRHAAGRSPRSLP